MKKFRFWACVTVVIVLIAAVILIYQQRNCLVIYDIPDQRALQQVLLSSDSIKVVDVSKKKVTLYETADIEEVAWVGESIVVYEGHRSSLAMEMPRYRLNFYRDSCLVASLKLKGELRLNWLQSEWDWKFDFWLTDESYRKILPWLCESTGKTVYELFPDPSLPPWVHSMPGHIDEDRVSGSGLNGVLPK